MALGKLQTFASCIIELKSKASFENNQCKDMCAKKKKNLVNDDSDIWNQISQSYVEISSFCCNAAFPFTYLLKKKKKNHLTSIHTAFLSYK